MWQQHVPCVAAAMHVHTHVLGAMGLVWPAHVTPDQQTLWQGGRRYLQALGCRLAGMRPVIRGPGGTPVGHLAHVLKGCGACLIVG